MPGLRFLGGVLGLLAICVVAQGRASAADFTGLTPLVDMGQATYKGFPGGLYEAGNEPPADHAAAGLAAAAAVEPLNAGGNPAGDGRVVLVSIGMSNTSQEFCSFTSAPPCDAWTFMGQAAAASDVNHSSLVIVNGAQGGQSADMWDSPADANYNRVRDTRLAPAGVTEAQVQAAWVKVANQAPSIPLPSSAADAYTLETNTGNVVRALKVRYPNLRLVFLSSRIYSANEPFAYESGFAMKWLGQAQVDQMRNGGVVVDARAGDLGYPNVAPWIGWGPYLWADGTNPRSDGLTWQPDDLDSDGTHPAQSGEEKVGTMLLGFFLNSPFSQCWFTGDLDGDGASDGCDGDDDNDAFEDFREVFVGTDAADACADTMATNDERGPDFGEPLSPWPVDINDDRQVGLTDILAYIPHFGYMGSQQGYSARFDLNADGRIGLNDILMYITFFGRSCTP